MPARTVPLRAKRGTEERVCKTCGKTFVFKLSQLAAYKGAGQFCSRTCSYAGIAAANAKKPIKDRYGRSHRKADRDWQLAVREKDNYTCARCGKYDRYIHAHHIASRARRPDLKHDVSNGICLDTPCHNWVHHHPIEAEALGFLSDAKYELRHLEQRFENMGKANRITLDEERIVALHRGGMRGKAIARELGVGEGPVYRVLKAHGCQPHPVGAPRRS